MNHPPDIWDTIIAIAVGIAWASAIVWALIVLACIRS